MNPEHKKQEQFVWAIGGLVLAAITVSVVVMGLPDDVPKNPRGEVAPVVSRAPIVEGASPVDSSGEVVTAGGVPVKLNVPPGSPEAPQQSAPITAEQVPASAVKIEMSAAGFSPAEFTAQAGRAITLSVTSKDEQTHVFKFDDLSLEAVAVGIGPQETRAITFNAPKAGIYTFYCDVPGHKTRGEVGRMIVR